jgi:hypothetical protein
LFNKLVSLEAYNILLENTRRSLDRKRKKLRARGGEWETKKKRKN